MLNELAFINSCSAETTVGRLFFEPRYCQNFWGDSLINLLSVVLQKFSLALQIFALNDRDKQAIFSWNPSSGLDLLDFLSLFILRLVWMMSRVIQGLCFFVTYATCGINLVIQWVMSNYYYLVSACFTFRGQHHAEMCGIIASEVMNKQSFTVRSTLWSYGLLFNLPRNL